MKEQDQILEMLQKGKITIEEAKELLNALDYEEPINKKNKNVISFDVDKAKEGFQGIEKSVNDFIKTTFATIFDKDFTFQIKGKFDLFQKLFNVDVSNMKNPELFIYNRNGSVQLEESDDDELNINVKVHYKNMENFEESDFFTFENDGEHISFKSKKPSENEQFYLEVVAQVPRKEFANIVVDTSNAPIFAEDILASKLDLSTTNGKIILEDSNVDELSITTSNGPINIEDTTGSVANVKSSNSKILMEDISFDEFKGATSNGRINGENLDFADLKLHTSNGSILLENLSTDRLKKASLKSSNGDLSIELGSLRRRANFDLATTSGRINLNIPVEMKSNSQKDTYSYNKHIIASTTHFEEDGDAIDFVLATANANINIEDNKNID